MNLSERVLSRLETSEKEELNPWFRDDIRIAWITVHWSARGIPEWCPYPGPANVAATYQVLHCHPDQVWSLIVARQKAMLGAEYELWYGEASSPKKPSTSERNPRWRKAA